MYVNLQRLFHTENCITLGFKRIVNSVSSYETCATHEIVRPDDFQSDGLRAAAQSPSLVLAMTQPKTVIASTCAGKREGRSNPIL